MLFFELLQITLGNRDRLSRSSSAEEWETLYEEAERQAVTGILLHGVDRLSAEQRPSQAILLQWIGIGHMIERRNMIMNKRCVKLLKMLHNYGLKGTILKGQGISCLYDKELQALRQSGDIDVYVDCGLEKAFKFAKSIGQKEIDWDYKHLHLDVWDDTEIEVHYRVEVPLNLWKNWKLQKWFHKHQDALFNDNVNHSDNESVNTNSANSTNGFLTPTVEFNVFYVLLHIYRHFLYEGIGLRQIVDYYFVLKAKANMVRLEKTDYAQETVSQFGMEKFARGLMWVMKETLGMPREWMLWAPNRKEGEFILNQLMKSGNFGHYKKRNNKIGGKFGTFLQICFNNMHLFIHYPADTIWAPLYFVCHKLWKIKTRMVLK